MRSRGSLIANISWLGVAEIVSRGLGFLATIMLARRLGTAAFGDYVVASAAAGYAMIVAVPGGDTIGVRMRRQQPDDQDAVAALLHTRLLGSVGACALLFCCAFALPLSKLQQNLLLLHVLLLPGLILNVSFVMQAEERMTVPAVGRVVQSALYVTGVAVVIWSADDVQYVPIILGVAMLAYALLTMGAAQRWTAAGMSFIKGVHVGRLRDVLRSAVPIMLSSLLIAVYYSMDSIMLGLMCSSEEAGMYGAAYRIVLLMVGGGALLYQAFMPRLSDPDMGMRREAHKKLVRIMTTIGMLAGGALAVFSEWILVSLYGAACRPAAPALMILGGVVFLVFVNVALASPMQLWGLERRHMMIVGAAASVNLALNFILIPRWGMVGAAGATIAAELIVLILTLLTWRGIQAAGSKYGGARGSF
jgi:O-antigen/teichoic acid export membrane protein